MNFAQINIMFFIAENAEIFGQDNGINPIAIKRHKRHRKTRVSKNPFDALRLLRTSRLSGSRSSW